MPTLQPESRLQQSLDEVTRLLDRHRVLETLTHRQEGPSATCSKASNIVRTSSNCTSACARCTPPTFEATIRYDENQIGHHMTHEWVAVPETHTVQQALGDLRSRGQLPPRRTACLSSMPGTCSAGLSPCRRCF